MLPIALHSIIPLFRIKIDGINGSIVAQAINYSQPVLFYSINIVVLVVVQVAFLIKKFKEEDHNLEINREKIINTGMFVTIFVSIFVSILFVCIMMTYSELSINNFGHKHGFAPTYTKLYKYSQLYIGVMAVYILFSGVSSYFVFMTLESGIKLVFIIINEFFFSILDILLSVIFLIYLKSLSPVIRISLGTLISTITKFIVVGIIYKIKVATWKFREMKINKYIVKEVIKQSWMLSTFMLVYAFNIVIQMSFMSSLPLSTNNYIYYKDGESLVIISRIIIFSILNMLVIIPKSLGRAINLSSTKPNKDNLNLAMNQFKTSRKYNFYGMLIFLFINFIIFFLINQITDVIFKHQVWTNDKISEHLNTIPFPHNENITYLDVIKKFIWDGFIITVFAEAVINFTINIRIFIFFNLEKNIPLFILTVVMFFISYSFGGYFFGYYFQSHFPGVIGFALAQLIYGAVSFILNTFFYFKITNKRINTKLEKLNIEKLKPFLKYKNSFNYFKDRKTKMTLCLKESNV